MHNLERDQRYFGQIKLNVCLKRKLLLQVVVGELVCIQTHISPLDRASSVQGTHFQPVLTRIQLGSSLLGP